MISISYFDLILILLSDFGASILARARALFQHWFFAMLHMWATAR